MQNKQKILKLYTCVGFYYHDV